MKERFLYSAFGLTLGSPIELPGTTPGAGSPDVLFRWGRVSHSDRKADDEVHVLFNRLAGTFQINNGDEIVIDPLAGADPQAIKAVLLGQAIAALLRQRGWLPLHVSAVAIEGRAVLFMGPSGAGKSTVAAAFYSRGHHLVSDDVGPVKTVNGLCVIRSGLSRLRLSELSLSLLDGNHGDPVLQVDKYAVDLVQAHLPDTLPVEAVYILDFSDKIPPAQLSVERLNPLLGAASLSVHSFFRRTAFVTEAIRSHVQACAAMAEVVPVYQVTRARSFLSLHRLIELAKNQPALACGSRTGIVRL